MLTIHVWPKRLKEFLLTHPLYKSPTASSISKCYAVSDIISAMDGEATL